MKAGEGRVKDFLKVILREAKGFLAEDREDQVWSLATMWKRVVEVQVWNEAGQSGGKV